MKCLRQLQIQCTLQSSLHKDFGVGLKFYSLYLNVMHWKTSNSTCKFSFIEWQWISNFLIKSGWSKSLVGSWASKLIGGNHGEPGSGGVDRENVEFFILFNGFLKLIVCKTTCNCTISRIGHFDNWRGWWRWQHLPNFWKMYQNLYLPKRSHLGKSCQMVSVVVVS